MPILALVSALAQFAPTIAGWLGGSKAEDVATKVVGIAQQVTGAASGDAALTSIQTDPTMAEKFQEAILANHLQLAQLAHDETMAEMAHDEKMVDDEVADRKDARAMQIATHSWVPGVLTMLITVGFFGILGFMLSNTVPKDNQAILYVMLGSLGTGWSAALSYWLGSSYGSYQKNNLLAQAPAIMPNPAKP